MTFTDGVCPYCGCHCEDDEFCAACGKVFHEEEFHATSRKFSLLDFLGSGLRSLLKKTQEGTRRDERDKFLNINYLAEQADQELDASWSCLSTNKFHDMKHG